MMKVQKMGSLFQCNVVFGDLCLDMFDTQLVKNARQNAHRELVARWWL